MGAALIAGVLVSTAWGGAPPTAPPSAHYSDSLAGVALGAPFTLAASRDSRGTYFVPASVAGEAGTLYVGTCRGAVQSLDFQIDVTNLPGPLPPSWHRAAEPRTEAGGYLSEIVGGMLTKGWAAQGAPMAAPDGSGVIQSYVNGARSRGVAVSCGPEDANPAATHCSVNVVAQMPLPCTEGL